MSIVLARIEKSQFTIDLLGPLENQKLYSCLDFTEGKGKQCVGIKTKTEKLELYMKR